MEMKKLDKVEQEKLRRALEANALTGAPIKMNPIDTSFELSDEQLEQDMINAIHSIPCHY